MREKFDHKIKSYHMFAVIVGVILLFSQFLMALKSFVIISCSLFSLYSIGILVDFVKREYRKEVLIVPIYSIVLTILYFAANSLYVLPYTMVSILAIAVAMILIFYSTYVLMKFKR